MKMWYPRESVGSVSSVVHAALAKQFFRTHRPRMTLIRRIRTDFLPEEDDSDLMVA